jgi:uncharacterized protein involved in outer membrane biogenesis
MRWKWILGILVVVIVAFFVVTYIILSSYDYNKLKPGITKMAKKHTGRDLTLAGDITLEIGFSPTLVVEDASFQNASWGSRPQMARLKRLEVQFDLLPILKGHINVRRLNIVDPDIFIEVDTYGKTNLDFDVSKEPGPETAGDKTGDKLKLLPGFKEVRVEGGTIHYNDHQTGKTTTINIEKLELSAPRFSDPTEIDLKANYNKTSFLVTGTLGQLSELMNQNEPCPLNLTIAAMDSTASVAGNITDIVAWKGIDLKLSAKGPDLANFQQFTGKELPVKGSFDVSGHLTAPTLESISISEISILLGESAISGDVTITQKSSRPRIDARLYSKKLDLRPYINQYKSVVKSEALFKMSDAKRKRVFSDKPFDIQAIQKFDAKISFRADQILGFLTALDNVDVNLNLQNGHLLIPLKANIGGGNHSSSLELLATEDQVNLTTKIVSEKVDLGDMRRKLGITRDLEGIIDLNINLTGQGNSVAALMAGLNGDVIAILGEGRIPVKYLNFVGADLKTSLTRLINPFKEKIDKHQINCAVFDFNIKDGMARSDVFVIDDPRKTLFSRGKINLKTEALDFYIHTKPKEGIGTEKTGKFSISLSKLIRPFKLGGTLARPSLKISATGIITTIGEALLGPHLFVSLSSGKDPCAEALKIAGEGVPETKATAGKEKE